MKRLLESIRQHQSEISLGLMIAAGLIGAWSQSYAPARLGDEMWRLADHLARQGTFADPFGSIATGPTAANPPLYPLLLAILIKILRIPWLVFGAAILMSILANAVVAAQLPRVSEVFYGMPDSRDFCLSAMACRDGKHSGLGHEFYSRGAVDVLYLHFAIRIPQQTMDKLRDIQRRYRRTFVFV